MVTVQLKRRQQGVGLGLVLSDRKMTMRRAARSWKRWFSLDFQKKPVEKGRNTCSQSVGGGRLERHKETMAKLRVVRVLIHVDPEKPRDGGE